MDIFFTTKDLGVTTNIIQYDKYSLLKFTLSNNGNDDIFTNGRINRTMYVYL
jgi:hypothetical protein